jgi:S-(hydroxymethyl)glutathione dehydrogenase / alcohol dehydrogenase
LSGETFGAVLTETGKPLEFMKMGLPALSPGQVLVEITWSGICRTQLDEIRGRKGPDKFLPHTLGHEGTGTVLETGQDVAKVQPGDKVVLSWLKGSGADVPGTQYSSPGCTINSGAISTFLTKAVVSENRVTPLPDGVPMLEGALFGCALPTGSGMVLHTAQVRAGQSVAIFGAGGIGLSALVAAAGRGASPLIAIDVVKEKLDLAISLGATHVIDATAQHVPSSIAAITGQDGADVVIEAAGQVAAMENAFQSTRTGGGLCIVAGNLEPGTHISIDPFQLIKGRNIVGSWGGESEIEKDIPEFARMMDKGKYDLRKLVTHTYPLTELNTAMNDLEAGRVGRALLSIGTDQSTPNEI